VFATLAAAQQSNRLFQLKPVHVLIWSLQQQQQQQQQQQDKQQQKH
jgi:hypothetical protein